MENMPEQRRAASSREAKALSAERPPPRTFHDDYDHEVPQISFPVDEDHDKCEEFAKAKQITVEPQDPGLRIAWLGEDTGDVKVVFLQGRELDVNDP
eukprot:10028629-Alexandrium_andersonii.AAC.1